MDTTGQIILNGIALVAYFGLLVLFGGLWLAGLVDRAKLREERKSFREIAFGKEPAPTQRAANDKLDCVTVPKRRERSYIAIHVAAPSHANCHNCKAVSTCKIYSPTYLKPCGAYKADIPVSAPQMKGD